MTNRAIDAGDVLTLSKKMGNLQPDMIKYMWRNDGDDFMLRTDLLSLKKVIEDVLERSNRADPPTRGTTS